MTSRTIVSEVHAVLCEHFANETPFTSHDVIQHLPWVEEYLPAERRHTTRISGALSALVDAGAVIRADKIKNKTIFITNKSLLDAWMPRINYRPIGLHLTRHPVYRVYRVKWTGLRNPHDWW